MNFFLQFVRVQRVEKDTPMLGIKSIQLQVIGGGGDETSGR
jgi:hypothetical protein